MTPRVSVIVAAIKERGYTQLAVNSVAHQTYPPELFETIVAIGPDVPVPSASSQLQSFRVVKVEDPRQPLGKTYADMIELAHGEVVTFLEDDDLYLPHRLERIASIFDQHADLCFYHNEIIIIDAEGRDRVGRHLPLTPRTLTIPPGERTVEEVRALTRTPAWHHPSAMALRRASVLPGLGGLRKIHAGPDYFLFSMALASRERMIVDPDRGTRIRVHPSQASQFTQDALSAYWARRAAHLNQFIGEMNQIRHDLDMGGASLHLDGNLAAASIQAIMASGKADRHELASQLPAALRAGLRLRYSYYLWATALGSMAMVDPHLPRALDRFFEVHRMSNILTS